MKTLTALLLAAAITTTAAAAEVAYIQSDTHRLSLDSATCPGDKSANLAYMVRNGGGMVLLCWKLAGEGADDVLIRLEDGTVQPVPVSRFTMTKPARSATRKGT